VFVIIVQHLRSFFSCSLSFCHIFWHIPCRNSWNFSPWNRGNLQYGHLKYAFLNNVFRKESKLISVTGEMTFPLRSSTFLSIVYISPYSIVISYITCSYCHIINDDIQTMLGRDVLFLYFLSVRQSVCHKILWWLRRRDSLDHPDISVYDCSLPRIVWKLSMQKIFHR
jgi:hypothetical protein